MPDVKLKAAMEEIKTVLKNYDICAIVLLSNQNGMEFLHELTATWTCARIQEIPGGHEIRIKAKREDFPTEEAHYKVLNDTVGTVFGFVDALQYSQEQMMGLAKMLGKHFEITHVTRGDKLPERAIAFLNQDICPDCKESGFIQGPRGGNSVNITCNHCGARFNVCLPWFAERI